MSYFKLTIGQNAIFESITYLVNMPLAIKHMQKIVFLITKTAVVVQKMTNTINMQLLISRTHFKCQDREESH